MNTSLFTSLLAEEEILLLLRDSADTFSIVGQRPLWCERCLPMGETPTPSLVVTERFPYLQVFLPEAEMLWASKPPGRVRSGTWTETDARGREIQLEATALCLAEGKVLLLRNIEDEFAQHRRILQRARERALDHERLLKETSWKEILLHCLVHDLAGPLSGMQGCFEMLERESDLLSARQLVQLGLEQAQKQSNLIRELLDIYRAEAGTQNSAGIDQVQLPDVLECAEEALREVNPSFALKQVTIESIQEPGSSGPWIAVGEQSRLERVFYNLLENALRYSPAGSRVQVRLSKEPPWIRAAIEDEGPGVAPEIAPQLFQRFVRGSRPSGKAGLGLFYCRITTEQWGGSIGCEPRPGGGSRFWFRLRMPSPTDGAVVGFPSSVREV